MVRIAPSLLSADFSNLKDEIASVSSAEMLHIDVMDGMFVPNITIGMPVVKSLREHTDMLLDVHLMIDKPVRYVKQFAEAGADIITVHAESDSFEETLRAITIIKDMDKYAGLAIKPGTDLAEYMFLFGYIDVLTIMTVEPGFGGQSFMYDMLPKIRTAKSLLSRTNPDCDIEVDGGINIETADLCVTAGAQILVAGSSIFSAPDREEVITALRNICY